MAIVPLTAACIAYVAVHFGLNEKAFRGLLETEAGRVGLVTPNHDKTGRVTSRDIGPFQVNDAAWLKHFTVAWHQPNSQATFALLRDNGCANAAAAGEIFRTYLDEAGGNYGVAVGYYNSHKPDLAEAYRRRFIDAYERMRSDREVALK